LDLRAATRYGQIGLGTDLSGEPGLSETQDTMTKIYGIKNCDSEARPARGKSVLWTDLSAERAEHRRGAMPW